MHRYYIELNTMKDIEEFTNICSRVSSDVTIRGKDENNCGWSLSAKSLLCSVVMSARLQRQRKHTAHEVDWDTVYVECKEDIYSSISKFIKR